MNLQKIIVVLLTVIAIGLFSLALDFAQPVLMPLIIGLLFSSVLAPAVEFLKRRLHVPRVIGITVVILMILGMVFLIGMLFYASLQSFVRVLPRYQAKFEEILISLAEVLNARFGISATVFSDIDWPPIFRGYLISLSGSFIDFAKGLFIVTIFLIFLLLEMPFFELKLENAFKTDTSRKVANILSAIRRQIGRYLSLKLIISAVTGLLIWLSLMAIGMDFPIVWGFAGFLFNFVPSIGSTLHFLIVSALGFVQFYPDSPGKILAVILAMLAIQTVIGNITDPRLQGQHLNISPFLVLFSLILWGWLWGPVGMLLATPIIVAVRIICENVPALYPVGVLMGKGIIKRKKKEQENG